MSDTILGGDVTVYYLDETRQKRLEWTGSATGTRTVNELYSALMDHFDEPAQTDNPSPMSAQTPVEYTVGTIDSSDTDPWYLSYELAEHLTGGAIKTAGWTRTEGSDIGIVVVEVNTGGAIVPGDVGNTISGVTTGNGTLLEVIETSGNDFLVIRPDSSAGTDSFKTSAQNLTCNAHVSVQTNAYNNTGEQIWANLYSIGTIASKTHIYVYQGSAGTDGDRNRVVSIVDNTQDWWGDGQIDMLLYTNDLKTQNYTTIDSGYATVFARKANHGYSHFEVATSLTSGGRNPIPLNTGSDLNHTTGWRTFTMSGTSGSFQVGDEINGDTSGARAILTDVASLPTVDYYLLDDPLTDFNGTEAITNVTRTGAATGSGAPANQGPALASWFTNAAAPSVTFGNVTTGTIDIDDDGTDEYYGIDIDCNSNPLTEVYEWLQYSTQRGQTGLLDGIEGETYIGGEVYLNYGTATVTGTIGEGGDITQETTGATGVIISHDATNKVILLRNTRGTFEVGPTSSALYTITDNDNSGTVEFNDTNGAVVESFSPSTVAPFGTFAGGTFFGARGVVLSNWVAGDENSFQLTPIDGGTKTRPQAITISVSNVRESAITDATADIVGVFRLTGPGGAIDKTEYSAAGGEAAGAATLDVDSPATIAQDVPGKTTGGTLVLVDATDNTDYFIRYSSWSGAQFTLANFASFTTTATTTSTQVTYATGGFNANVKRGDLVYATGPGGTGVSYVKTVDSDTQLTIEPAITGLTAGDTVEINCVPITLVDTADSIYVPLLWGYPTGDPYSVSIVYSSTIDYRVNVRNNRHTTKIVPFTADGQTTGVNKDTAVVRTTDSISS